jgi:hypothetical protein
VTTLWEMMNFSSPPSFAFVEEIDSATLIESHPIALQRLILFSFLLSQVVVFILMTLRANV